MAVLICILHALLYASCEFQATSVTDFNITDFSRSFMDLIINRFPFSCSIYSPVHSTDFSNRLCLYVPQTDGITIILSHQVTSGVDNSSNMVCDCCVIRCFNRSM